jgi:hypothetical protein
VTNLYNETDFKRASFRRKRLLLIYIVAAVAGVGLCAWFFLMRDTWNSALMLTLCITVTTIFGSFSLFFFSQKYAPVKNYSKFLKSYKVGLYETRGGKFLRFDPAVQTQYGISCYSMVCEEKVIKRQDFPERKVLIDSKKSAPDLKEGQKVKYKTFAGVLVGYEIIETTEVI